MPLKRRQWVRNMDSNRSDLGFIDIFLRMVGSHFIYKSNPKKPEDGVLVTENQDHKKVFLDKSYDSRALAIIGFGTNPKPSHTIDDSICLEVRRKGTDGNTVLIQSAIPYESSGPQDNYASVMNAIKKHYGRVSQNSVTDLDIHDIAVLRPEGFSEVRVEIVGVDRSLTPSQGIILGRNANGSPLTEYERSVMDTCRGIGCVKVVKDKMYVTDAMKAAKFMFVGKHGFF
jgi:hypothetical protein